MFDPGSVLAGSAAITAGLGIFGALNNTGPDVGQAPPPSNYYEYDSDGNLVREQVWDASKNGYVSRAYQTEEQKQEAAAKKALRDQFMNNLGRTPEDRIKAYDEYATNFSKQMHKDVDKAYSDITTATEERMNVRGMTGSRADVDLQKELAGEKLEADTDIAEKSAIARESLSQADKQYWLQGMTALDSGLRADQVLELNRAQNAANITQQGTAATLGAYTASMQPQLLKWQNKLNQANQFMNTSSGLAFLYGLYGKGGNKTTGLENTSDYRLSNPSAKLGSDLLWD